ncbi:MAG: hypothetical protein ACR2GW_06530, partial [Pyrinomonadaceae bacterium]
MKLMNQIHARRISLTSALMVVCLCANLSFAQTARSNNRESAAPRATVADAQQFVADAEKRLAELGVKLSQASWVQSNFITVDTEALAAEANKEFITVVTGLAEAANK